MQKAAFRIIYSWVAVFLWCGVIFYLSSIPNLKTELGFWDLILRKIAHITEYAALFLLARKAFYETGSNRGRKRVFLWAIGFSVLYAFSDEYHQSFVPGRCQSLIDVGIDTAGVIAGFIGYNAVKDK